MVVSRIANDVIRGELAALVRATRSVSSSYYGGCDKSALD